MPVKRKTAAKRKKPAGLAKYQAKLKKATSAIDKKIKKSESITFRKYYTALYT